MPGPPSEVDRRPFSVAGSTLGAMGLSRHLLGPPPGRGLGQVQRVGPQRSLAISHLHGAQAGGQPAGMHPHASDRPASSSESPPGRDPAPPSANLKSLGRNSAGAASQTP